VNVAVFDVADQFQTRIELQGALKVICPLIPALEIPASAFMPNHVTHTDESTPEGRGVYEERC
jgi:hypothetical protein